MINQQQQESNRAFAPELIFEEMFYEGYYCRPVYQLYSDGTERVTVKTYGIFGELGEWEGSLEDYVIYFGLGLEALAELKAVTRKQVAA